MFSSSKLGTLCFLMFFSCIVVQECKGGGIKGYDIPISCSKIDCPKYNVIHSEKEFEIRSYNQALWVTNPSVVEKSLMVGLGYAAQNLSGYYEGENDRKERIVQSGSFLIMDILKSTYTAYYYVPYKYQNGGLPKPSRSDIKQVMLPKYKLAAVRRVNRVLVDEEVPKEINAMKKYLQSTPYQRATNRDQFTFILYNYNGIDFTGFEVLIWFD